MIDVKIYLEGDGKIPEYQHVGDAGCDVFSADETFMLAPGERRIIHTGVYLDIPKGIEAQVRPRSGLALKNGITVLNSPGTIDSGYRGECNVILINHSNTLFTVEKGMRIGQFVFNRYENVNFIKVEKKEDLDPSERGEGGFGSTNV